MSKTTFNERQLKQPSNRLIPVPEWNQHHPWPPPGGLRHLIFNKETNGFASAFKRVRGRVLVDEPEFFRCIERQNGGREVNDLAVFIRDFATEMRLASENPPPAQTANRDLLDELASHCERVAHDIEHSSSSGEADD